MNASIYIFCYASIVYLFLKVSVDIRSDLDNIFISRQYSENICPSLSDGWMDGWMDEWMDGLMDGRMNGWMDG